MMSCRVLYNETIILLNGLKDMGFLDGPLADVCPFFGSLGIFFLCVRRLPPCIPVICKLLEEVCFDVGRL